MADRLPALHLMVYDHLATIRALRPLQQAMYTQILCYCHLSRRRGFLQQPSGKPYSKELLAQMTGFSADMVSLLLQELLDAEVISCNAEGIVFVPWIVTAEHKRILCKVAGAKGGNPTLKGPPKGPVKGLSNHPLIPISEDENETSSGGKDKRGPGREGREEFRGEFVRLFRLKLVTDDEIDEMDRIVDTLLLKGAVVKDIAIRLNRYRLKLPNALCTPQAFLRHFDTLAPPAAASTAPMTPEDIEARIAQDDLAWLALTPEERERQTREAMDKAAPQLSAGAKPRGRA